MAEQEPRRICIILEKFPITEEPGFSAQLEMLEDMGNSLHIITLDDSAKTYPGRINAGIKRLSFSLPRMLQALGTLILMLMITPVNSIRAFCLMLKLLVLAGHPLRVLKSYLLAALAVNEDIIPLEITHIHSEAFPETSRIAVFASVLSGLKASFTVLPIHIYSHPSRETAILLGKGSFIITISAYDRKHLCEDIFKGKMQKPLIVSLPLGIDLNTFTFNRKYRVPAEPFNLITVGSLKKKKGVHTVLHALKLLKDRGMRFAYTVIGEGEEKKHLKALTEELGLSDCVTFCGNVPRLKIIQKMREADLFVIAPEIAADGDRDSIPVAILESMALGVPVAATRVTGISEVIEDGETGILAPPSDPLLLADACESILKEPEMRQMLIIKARLFIEGCCDLEMQTMRLSEFMQKSGIL